MMMILKNGTNYLQGNEYTLQNVKCMWDWFTFA